MYTHENYQVHICSCCWRTSKTDKHPAYPVVPVNLQLTIEPLDSVISVTRYRFLKRYHVTKYHRLLQIMSDQRSSSNPMSLILDALDQLGVTIGDIVLECGGHEHPAVESIFSNVEKILDALVGHDERTQQMIARWSSRNTTKFLQDGITIKHAGFHFSM